MKIINQIKTSSIVAIDIETVRIANNYSELTEDYKSAWQYKNKQDGVVPSEEELGQLWIKNSALYAEFSQVCAVSLVWLNKEGDNLQAKEFYGENEGVILKELAEVLNKIASSPNQYRLVGHASKFFDYSFLFKRYIINDLDLPSLIHESNKKPWEAANLCTNEIWKSNGTGAGSSLQALCTCLGVPVSKVDLVGDEVGAAYYRGEFKRIAEYCTLDTIAVFNIMRKWKKESIFDPNTVVRLGTVKSEEVSSLSKLVRELPLTEKDKDVVDKLKKDKRKAADPLKEVVDTFEDLPI